MYTLNINQKIDISNLKCYMLNELNRNDFNNSTRESTVIKKVIPKNCIYTNYNKLKSKYHENLDSKFNSKKNLSDKLFWLFYKIYNNYSDDDLNYINIFTTEKEFKLEIINKINLNKDLLKSYKIQKNSIISELANEKTISLNTLKALCILYNINLLIIKDNNTYSRFTKNNSENTIDNLDKYHIIKLIYNNQSSINNNYKIQLNIHIDEIKNSLYNFFYVNNLEKPLKSISSYKLPEIIEIANKLNISIINSNNKKKTKIELYSDCLKKLS